MRVRVRHTAHSIPSPYSIVRHRTMLNDARARQRGLNVRKRQGQSNGRPSMDSASGQTRSARFATLCVVAIIDDGGWKGSRDALVRLSMRYAQILRLKCGRVLAEYYFLSVLVRWRLCVCGSGLVWAFFFVFVSRSRGTGDVCASIMNVVCCAPGWRGWRD